MAHEAHEMEKERQHLRETIAIVEGQWAVAAQDSEKQAARIQEIREERKEDGTMDIGGLYSAQGFLELLELNQGDTELTHAASAREEAERTLRKLARMKDAPYFARVDFRFEDGVTKPIYIGRATLMDEDTFQIYVYDWRVPIASVFYQYGVGPAEYEAPAGLVRGDVLLKRQYEIRHGELVYFFDANEQVFDTFLRDLLARPASTEMKSILETIQREQDMVIRDLKSELLMVQGAAGSGKTSVALHRVAYLMYQGLQANRLYPHDIVIIAPNAAFERYISRVLPDLGEKQVQTMLLEELLKKLLPGADIQRRREWVEARLSGRRQEEGWPKGFKGSSGYITMLDRLIRELPTKWIPFADVDYDGHCVLTRELAQVEICNSTKKVPLGVKLSALARKIWEQIHGLRDRRYAKLLAFANRFVQHAMEVEAFARMLSIRESGRLYEQIQAFAEIDCVRLYRQLYADRAAFLRLSEGLLTPAEAESLRLATLDALSGDEIPFDDAVAIAYLEARIYGHRAFTHIKQVVVDEAQDMGALQATLLGMLFPNARFTVLGDMHQALTGGTDSTLYDEIEMALRKKTNRRIALDKSFRCTREIWDFCAYFLLPEKAGESYSRSGEAPRIHAADDRAAMEAALIAQAQACRAAGQQSVAIICKTDAEATALHASLLDRLPVTLIGQTGLENTNDVFVISLYMAKGLEFDAVLMADVDALHYSEPEDKNLLYVGCSRALHALHIFYAGERSPLLPLEEVRK